MLLNKVNQPKIEKEAKNTILFLGDGMSIPTLTASRIYKGQVEGLPNGGEEGVLHMDSLPHTALSKVFKCLFCNRFSNLGLEPSNHLEAINGRVI
jgi:alkaline phosphatase